MVVGPGLCAFLYNLIWKSLNHHFYYNKKIYIFVSRTWYLQAGAVFRKCIFARTRSPLCLVVVWHHVGHCRVMCLLFCSRMPSWKHAKNRTDWSPVSLDQVLHTPVFLISKSCSAIWTQLQVLQNRTQQGENNPTLIKALNVNCCCDFVKKSAHLLSFCWDRNHCSCACPAAPRAFSPSIPGVHPRRTLTLMPPVSSYSLHSTRVNAVWTPGCLSLSC